MNVSATQHGETPPCGGGEHPAPNIEHRTGGTTEAQPTAVQPSVIQARSPTIQNPIRVSVIIPAYNEERLIATAVRSVHQSESPLIRAGAVEVIVVDNASTDGTAAAARQAGASVLFESHRQIGRARNAGARIARGDSLIFLDADSEMHPCHLQRVADLLGAGRVIGGGAVLSMDARWEYRLIVGVWNRISVWGRMAAGSFFFCDRAAFQKVGGFDERLYAGEELSLSRRLRDLGCTQRKQFVVLDDLPVKTSNRKVVDHTRWEITRELAGLAFRGWKGLGDPRACRFWYPDERR